MIDLAEDDGCLVAELVDASLQAGQDPAAGDVDGADGESQVGRRDSRGAAVDGGQPERPPGGRGELAFDLIGGPAEQLPAVLGLEDGGGRRVAGRLGFEELLDAGRPAAAEPVRPAGQEVDQEVAGDAREPAAEAAAGRVEVPALDGPGDRAKHLLAEVVRVGVLEPLAPGEPVDQRLVERHELAPGPGIGRVAELDDQRVSRRWRGRLVHRSSFPPPGYTQAGRGSFRIFFQSRSNLGILIDGWLRTGEPVGWMDRRSAGKPRSPGMREPAMYSKISIRNLGRVAGALNEWCLKRIEWQAS